MAVATATPLKIGLPVDSFGQWTGGMALFGVLSEAMARAAPACGAEIRLIATAPPSVAATLADGIATIPCASARAVGAVGAFLRQTTFSEISLATTLAVAVERLGLDFVGPSSDDLGSSFPVPWCAYPRDLQHRRLPDLFSGEERRMRDAQLAKLMAHSQIALADSMDAAAELGALMAPGSSPEGLSCLPTFLPEIAAETLPSEATVRSLLGLETSPYFVCCSRQSGHKHHEVIIEAFARAVRDLGDTSAKLVFTGEQGDPRRPQYRADLLLLIKRLGLTGRVHHYGFIERPLQCALIRYATGLVLASAGETAPGAGGSVEAACLGTPVVAVDAPVNHALPLGRFRYFPLNNVGALSEQLKQLFQQPERSPPVLAAAAGEMNLISATGLVRRFSDHCRPAEQDHISV